MNIPLTKQLKQGFSTASLYRTFIMKKFKLAYMFLFISLHLNAFAGPQTSEDLNTLGYRAYTKKNYKKAEEYFKKALAEDPKHELANFNLACVYSLQGKNEEALSYLEQSFLVDKVERTRKILDDEDLDNFRKSPYFLELLMRMKPDVFSMGGSGAPYDEKFDIESSTISVSTQLLINAGTWYKQDNPSCIHYPTMKFMENRKVSVTDSGFGEEAEPKEYRVVNNQVLLIFPEGGVVLFKYKDGILQTNDFNGHGTKWVMKIPSDYSESKDR